MSEVNHMMLMNDKIKQESIACGENGCGAT